MNSLESSNFVSRNLSYRRASTSMKDCPSNVCQQWNNGVSLLICNIVEERQRANHLGMRNSGFGISVGGTKDPYGIEDMCFPLTKASLLGVQTGQPGSGCLDSRGLSQSEGHSFFFFFPLKTEVSKVFCILLLIFGTKQKNQTKLHILKNINTTNILKFKKIA